MSNIPYDKKLHFGAGFIVVIIAAVVSNDIRIAMLAAVLAGVAKEVYDQITYGGFDCADMIATWLGGACGTIIYIIWIMREALFRF